MASSLGPVRYMSEANSGYLSINSGLRTDLSQETAELIDKEIRRLVEGAQEQATTLLQENRAALDEIAAVLLKKEVINGDEICEIARRHSPSQSP